MAIKISFGCSKGGVGRTTNTIMLSYYLALKGNKVLVVDIDSQEDTTGFFLGLDFTSKLIDEYGKNYADHTIMALFNSKTYKDEPNRLIYKTRYNNIDILPSIVDLRSQEHILYENPTTSLTRLKHYLNKVENNYDYIIMDTKAETDIFAQNVYVSSDYIVIIMSASGLDLKGMKLVMDVVNELQNKLDNVGKIIAILLNKIDYRTRQTREFIDFLKQNFSDLLIDNYIKNLNIYSTQLSLNKTIWELPELPYLKSDPIKEVETVYAKLIRRMNSNV